MELICPAFRITLSVSRTEGCCGHSSTCENQILASYIAIVEQLKLERKALAVEMCPTVLAAGARIEDSKVVNDFLTLCFPLR